MDTWLIVLPLIPSVLYSICVVFRCADRLIPPGPYAMPPYPLTAIYHAHYPCSLPVCWLSYLLAVLAFFVVAVSGGGVSEFRYKPCYFRSQFTTRSLNNRFARLECSSCESSDCEDFSRESSVCRSSNRGSSIIVVSSPPELFILQLCLKLRTVLVFPTISLRPKTTVKKLSKIDGIVRAWLHVHYVH